MVVGGRFRSDGKEVFDLEEWSFVLRIPCGKAGAPRKRVHVVPT